MHILFRFVSFPVSIPGFITCQRNHIFKLFQLMRPVYKIRLITKMEA